MTVPRGEENLEKESQENPGTREMVENLEIESRENPETRGRSPVTDVKSLVTLPGITHLNVS